MELTFRVFFFFYYFSVSESLIYAHHTLRRLEKNNYGAHSLKEKLSGIDLH